MNKEIIDEMFWISGKWKFFLKNVVKKAWNKMLSLELFNQLNNTFYDGNYFLF